MSPVPAETARDLLAWLTSHQSHMVSATRALCRIESPTGDSLAQLKVFALLGTLLEDADYRSRIHAVGTPDALLVATQRQRPRKRPLQLLIGHSDTVWPRGSLEQMPLTERDGCLFGPGTYDCKAGLVQAIFALRALRALGLEPTLSPVLMVNADEETGSLHSTRGITRIASIADRAFVLEPSLGPQGHLKTARKGVGHFTVNITGRSAHAGLDPDRGVSATVELAHVIHALHALNDPGRGISVNIGEIRGGTRRNVIPQSAGAEVDVRTYTREHADWVTARIREIQPTHPEAKLQISGGFVKPPLERSPEGQELWRSAKGLADQLGFPLDHGIAGGASDGNTTARFCATLDGLGAVGDGAHATHEHVRIDTMPQRAALLAGLLLS